MVDTYKSFDALHRSRRQGRDFLIRWRNLNSATVIVAPHGGGIEPGTSEIAESLAGGDLSFYIFEGIKPSRNKELHVASTNFNEPDCLTLVTAAERAITIHGENSRDEIVFLGGRDAQGAAFLHRVLESQGFAVACHNNPDLQGLDKSNICNRGRLGAGIQFELSHGLRLSLFQSLSPAGRRLPTERFRLFVATVRDGMQVVEGGTAT